MNEIRKVIAVVESLVPNKNEISFPSVRAWIRGANDYVTGGLEQLFPERGTVYLHVSACENHRPQRNQVGLFQCAASPGQKAEWRVNSTSRHLAKVIDCPISGNKPELLPFWEWLADFKEAVPCNILLSQGVVYVRRGKQELIGPFITSSENRLTFRDQTFLFEGVDVVSIEISGRHYGFIDTEILPKGKPLIIDPREAIHRRLKLVSKTSNLEWLSRAKAQELSTALAGVSVIDGSEWVMNDLPRALEALVALGKLDAKVPEELLQIKELDDALQVAWKRKHEGVIKESQEEISALKTIADGIKQAAEGIAEKTEQLKREKSGLEDGLLELQGRIAEAKVQAQQVFETELVRLAHSPASMALLGAWIGGQKRPANGSHPLLRIQHPSSILPQAADLKAALFNNFKACSLSPTVATELTTVCLAALAAGQPIVFRSLLADLLAEGVACALGQPATVWANIPAGLLDPVNWSELIPDDLRQCPLILQNANRSDIPLVLGAFYPALLRQALGYQKPDGIILLTLESNEEMEVPSNFPFGPLIDDRLLRFYPAKATSTFNAFPEFAKELPGVAAVSAEEFAEIGDPVRRLPLFSLSAQENVFRRAYSALRGVCEDQNLLPRLFFKYWCLPRCLPEDTKGVIEAHKESWAQDKTLTELREAFDYHG